MAMRQQCAVASVMRQALPALKRGPWRGQMEALSAVPVKNRTNSGALKPIQNRQLPLPPLSPKGIAVT